MKVPLLYFYQVISASDWLDWYSLFIDICLKPGLGLVHRHTYPCRFFSLDLNPWPEIYLFQIWCGEKVTEEHQLTLLWTIVANFLTRRRCRGNHYKLCLICSTLVQQMSTLYVHFYDYNLTEFAQLKKLELLKEILNRNKESIYSNLIRLLIDLTNRV